MWGMITALVSGALMSIQGVFNSAVMKQTSMWVSAGWVQISAFVVCLLMWLFTGRGAVSDRTAVYADRRRDRGIYHVHGHQEL